MSRLEWGGGDRCPRGLWFYKYFGGLFSSVTLAPKVRTGPSVAVTAQPLDPGA